MHRIYCRDDTQPEEEVLWAMVAFCRECGEIATKARRITPSLKPIVEKVAGKYAMCDNADHNDFDDCNFNFDALWFREWSEKL